MRSGRVIAWCTLLALTAAACGDTGAPATPTAPEPGARYDFGGNHPAAHGVAGRMRTEQVLTTTERTVTVVAETGFQPGVGFECVVTFDDSDGPSDRTGFLFVGDDAWVDGGSGWERPDALSRVDTEEICGIGLRLFDSPDAEALLRGGEPAADQAGGLEALRLDLAPGQGLLGSHARWVGLSEPATGSGSVWVVDRSWYGRVELALSGAPGGPLGEVTQDYTLTITYPEVGTDVEIAPPSAG